MGESKIGPKEAMLRAQREAREQARQQALAKQAPKMKQPRPIKKMNRGRSR